MDWEEPGGEKSREKLIRNGDKIAIYGLKFYSKFRQIKPFKSKET